MTYASPEELQPSTADQTVTPAPSAASRYARVRGSPRSLLANPLARSARDHRSGGSPSRPRRAGVGPCWGRIPGGCAADDYASAFHLRLRGRRSRAWPAGFGAIAGLHGGAESGAVVLAEGVLFAFADARVRVDVGGVLDLVLGHGQHDQLLAVEPGTADRREALPGPE